MKEESSAGSDSVSEEGTEQSLDNRASVYWLLLGTLVTAIISFMLFTQGSTIVQKLSDMWSRTVTSDVAAADSVAPSVWRSGVHASDAAVKDYGWATSPQVESKTWTSFLRSSPEARIQVSCGDDWEFVSVEFTEAPEIVDSTSIGGGFNRINASVAWDGETEAVEFLQETGSKTISFADGQAAISKLAMANMMHLTLRWHGQETAEFEFPLQGSSAAISEMWGSCR